MFQMHKQLLHKTSVRMTIKNTTQQHIKLLQSNSTLAASNLIYSILCFRYANDSIINTHRLKNIGSTQGLKHNLLL